MPSIQVKNVPREVHAELHRRAGNEGRSLQEYVLDLLVKETAHPPIKELLATFSSRSGGRVSFAEAAALVREDRDSH